MFWCIYWHSAVNATWRAGEEPLLAQQPDLRRCCQRCGQVDQQKGGASETNNLAAAAAAARIPRAAAAAAAESLHMRKAPAT